MRPADISGRARPMESSAALAQSSSDPDNTARSLFSLSWTVGKSNRIVRERRPGARQLDCSDSSAG
jgi:hypothetical protein